MWRKEGKDERGRSEWDVGTGSEADASGPQDGKLYWCDARTDKIDPSKPPPNRVAEMAAQATPPTGCFPAASWPPLRPRDCPT